MSAHVIPSAEDLLEIAEQVWSSYLDPAGSNVLLPGSPTSDQLEISAAVSVTGSWNGHIVLETTATASQLVAAAMLGAEPDELSEPDIADALGEVANVIGGNVKNFLPDGCALSLPHVVASPPGQRRRWPSTVEVSRLDCVWQAQPVTVSVLESTSDHAKGGGAI